MIQGVTTIVAASILIVDENTNFKVVLECALILNGMYFVTQHSKIINMTNLYLCAKLRLHEQINI